MEVPLACTHQHCAGWRLAPGSTADPASLSTLPIGRATPPPPPLVQARKQFPQLMEFAQRLECGGELGAETVSTFMHQVLRRRTAASYDNIIARSGMDDEEEVRPAVGACLAMARAEQVIQSAKVSACIVVTSSYVCRASWVQLPSCSVSRAFKARVAMLSHRAEAGQRMSALMLSEFAAAVQRLGWHFPARLGKDCSNLEKTMTEAAVCAWA